MFKIFNIFLFVIIWFLCVEANAKKIYNGFERSGHGQEGMEKLLDRMHRNMGQMELLLKKFENEKDATEKENLWRAQMQSMQDQMGMMKNLMTQMKGMMATSYEKTFMPGGMQMLGNTSKEANLFFMMGNMEDMMGRMYQMMEKSAWACPVNK